MTVKGPVGEDYSNSIAVYGGAFDPFHLGHASVIKHLVDTIGFGSVIVVPSGTRPDKDLCGSAEHRLAMTRIGVQQCFGEDGRIAVSDVHVSGRLGYGTIDLVRYFNDIQESDVYIVIGSELVSALTHWKSQEQLQTEARFIVIPRPGESADFEIGAQWRLTLAEPLGADGSEISSSEIRTMWRRNEDIARAVPSTVADYIRSNQLYLSGR